MATVGVKGLTDGFTDADVKLSVAFITVQYAISRRWYRHSVPLPHCSTFLLHFRRILIKYFSQKRYNTQQAWLLGKILPTQLKFLQQDMNLLLHYSTLWNLITLLLCLGLLSRARIAPLVQIISRWRPRKPFCLVCIGYRFYSQHYWRKQPMQPLTKSATVETSSGKVIVGCWVEVNPQ